MQFDRTGDGLVVVDEFRNSISLSLPADVELSREVGDLSGFSTAGYDPGPGRSVETDRLAAAPVAVTVVDLDAPGTEHVHLADGESATVGPQTGAVLRTPVLCHVRPETTGIVHRTADAVRLELDETARVDLGFETTEEAPGAIRVERSLEGVTRGLTAMGAATPHTSPDRSFPNVRGTPPRLSFGSPRGVASRLDERPDTDTEVVVPEANGLAHLLPTAGLVHYLGAEVTVDADADGTTLRAGSETVRIGDTPAETDETASWVLRLVFSLDCLARTAGPYGTALEERRLLDELGLDAAALYDAPLAERVRRYLDHEDQASLRDELPEWHLGLHVEPTLDRVPALSHYLDRLADVYSPAAANVATVADRVQWAAEQSRSTERVAGENDLMLAPADRARTVGWYGPRRALGAFNVLGDGPRPRPLAEGDLSVTVVQVGTDLGVNESVSEFYRERDLPMDVTVLLDPTVEQLAATFERPTDLLHFVGHHDPGGLRCTDGLFTPEMLSECGVEAFFLNACGSIETGEKLVRRGAAAGAVTTRSVFDESATQVGCDWARLIALGWSVERALDLARRVDQPDGYVSVGDGTHRVAQSDIGIPPEITLHTDPEGTNTVELCYGGPIGVGNWVRDQVSSQTMLTTTEKKYEVDELDEKWISDTLDNPVDVGDELVWEADQLFK